MIMKWAGLLGGIAIGLGVMQASLRHGMTLSEDECRMVDVAGPACATDYAAVHNYCQSSNATCFQYPDQESCEGARWRDACPTETGVKADLLSLVPHTYKSMACEGIFREGDCVWIFPGCVQDAQYSEHPCGSKVNDSSC